MQSHRTVAAIASLVALVAIGARPAAAQTIRPVVSEYQLEAHGRFEVVNDSDRPLNVVVEPRGFSVSDTGDLQDEPFPAGVHLRLSSTSLRLPPRQSRIVFYEATADRGPAWFVLYANFTGFPAREFSGVNVQLELPHVVYLLPKETWKRTDLHVSSADLPPGKGVMALVIENTGANFGRVSSLQIVGPRRKITVPGFPVFPGRRRVVEIPWDGTDAPDSVDVKTKDFSFAEPLPLRAP